MKHAELGKNFKVFLSDDEMARLKRMLSLMGSKMAPFTRQLLLREMEKQEMEGGK